MRFYTYLLTLMFQFQSQSQSIVRALIILKIIFLGGKRMKILNVEGRITIPAIRQELRKSMHVKYVRTYIGILISICLLRQSVNFCMFFSHSVVTNILFHALLLLVLGLTTTSLIASF